MRETRDGRVYRPRHSGCLYKQKPKDDSGYEVAAWWVKVTHNGRPYYKSTGTANRREAERFLKRELAKLEHGTFVEPKFERITIAELLADSVMRYRAEGNQNEATRTERRWNLHLRPTFGQMRANSLGTDAMRTYRAKRVAEGASNTSVNRELQILRKAYRLAAESDPPKVQRIPRFSFPREDNARKVFIDADSAARLRAAASMEGLWARVYLEMLFTLGWRKTELIQLQAKNVDLATKCLRIETSKNGEPREVPLTLSLATWLEALVVRKKPEEALFPVKDFRYAWKRICRAAGVTPGRKGFVIHDTRRTSAKTKRAAGVPESVAMEIQGWKSPAMFRRYGIVDNADRLDALNKQEQYEREFGYSFGYTEHPDAATGSRKGVN